ncbi:hypothetical protein CTAM01_14261 [Colletotrichum tamarilloi]|uniref:Uncharacterized protein n=1 Tax=Colletotrichum tamarilloi TaxID=1209934 RepID=A0ABQ9QPR7_9PEZI|nr:uncharacterized protein CTAM01_14261 [Colletotrichum tamarilloi]KAK1480699.1 hypothetical protein CTAM01_14261 [Colletotrichum tamarilloi]
MDEVLHNTALHNHSSRQLDSPTSHWRARHRQVAREWKGTVSTSRPRQPVSGLHSTAPATAQSTELASHSTAALPSRSLALASSQLNLTGLHRQPSNEPPGTSPRNPFRSRVRRRHTSDICALIHRAIIPTAIDPLRLCRLSSSSMSHN